MSGTGARVKSRRAVASCAVLVTSALVLTVLSACERAQEPTPAERPAVTVEVEEIQRRNAPDVHEAVGTVRARWSATLAAKVMAVVEEIPVEAGDVVQRGQLLARLDDRELRAEFERARADYVRFEGLLEKNAVTRAEFESVQSRYRVAEAALSHARVRAPFDGVVTQKFGDAGDLAVPGKPLFAVERPAEFRLEATVPERLSGSVGLGQKVGVVVDATREECVGTIGEIIPAADPASRTFLVKIDLQCSRLLKSGMFGRVQLPVGERPGVFVAKEALHHRGQLTYVFVVAEGRARMRLVKIGRDYPDGVEVLAGLEPGERVIVAAEGEVGDGQRITEVAAPPE